MLHVAFMVLFPYIMVNMYFLDFFLFLRSSLFIFNSFSVDCFFRDCFQLFLSLIQSFYKYKFFFSFHMSSCVNIIHILVSIIVLFGPFRLFLSNSFWSFSALFGPFRLFSVLFGSFRSFSVISRTRKLVCIWRIFQFG